MTNTFPKKILITIFIVLAVAVFGILYFLNSSDHLSFMPGDENQNIASQSGSGLPIRLKIPSIGVDAPVIYVGLAADGSVAVPSGPSETAWYQLGSRPGQEGSAVITGHFGPWQTGASSVFDNLHQLKPGDKIYVKDDRGEELIFEVKGSRTYLPDESAPEVFNKTDGTYLNLITCSGDWLKTQKTYTERLVVFTELVEK